MKRKILIIGAGPTGLSVAYKLQHLDANLEFLVLEKEEKIGGISKSIEISNAIFDLGGHSFHTPYEDVENLVKNIIPVDGLERDARVLFRNVLIPYPFQKFYHKLPFKDVVKECEQGLEEVKRNTQKKEFKNFYEYILQTFGKGISKYFMVPYNQKLWGRDLRTMSVEWVKERVASPKGIKEEFKKDGKRRPLQPKMIVYYPQKGGFGEIFKAMAQSFKDKILVGEEVIKVDLAKRRIFTSTGKTFGWNILVNTMPIVDFVKLVSGISDSQKEYLLDLKESLEYLSLRIDFFVINHRPHKTLQRIYSGESDIPPHKTALNHNSSNWLKRHPFEAVIMETSFSPSKPLPPNLDDRLLNSLKLMKLIKNEKDIVDHKFLILKYAYPVYTEKRLKAMNRIREFLKNYNVFTIGRFGGWEYINSDKCIKIGIELADEIINNKGHER